MPHYSNWILDFSSPKNKTNCPLIRGYTKFDLMADEGKERLNPSREKNLGKHRERKVDEKSCDLAPVWPRWYVHKPDVQNKWEDNTHTNVLVQDC